MTKKRVLDLNGLTHLTGKIRALFDTKADLSAGTYVVTTGGNGTAYTATVPGITELKAGVNFIMIPHVTSTSTDATLDVNGLGAKRLNRRVSGSTVLGTSSANNDWLTVGRPIRVMYSGVRWVADMDKPNMADAYGTLLPYNGGTGVSNPAEGNYLVGGAEYAAMVEKTPEEVRVHIGAAKIADAAPINLLDNSNFRDVVNQRGQTTYTTSGYTIDRWKSLGSNLAVIVQSSDVRITNGGTSGSIGFKQFLPARKTPSAGTKVTFAVGWSGVTFSGSAAMPESGYVTVATTTQGAELRIIAATDTENASVSIYCPSGFSGNLLWAALYEGEYAADQLPAYKPKGYAAELAECQRYFYQINAAANMSLSIGAAVNTTDIYVPLHIASMVAKPTIAGAEGLVVSNGNFGSVTNVTSVTLHAVCLNSGYATLKVVTSATGITANSTYRLGLLAGKPLAFSAEL